MFKCKAVIALFIAVLFCPAIAWANPKPSFDCAKASSFAEIAICSNDELAQLDVRMSKAYKAHLAASSNIASEKAAQRYWVKKREACGSVACIKKLYGERIPELGGGIVVATANSAAEPAATYVVDVPTDKYLSLRTDPSDEIGRRIGKMANGTEVKVLDRRSDGWWSIEVIATGQKGYAFSGSSSKQFITPKPSISTSQAKKTSNEDPAGYFVVASLPSPSDFIWLHSNPSVLNGEQIGKLASGTVLEVLERTNGAWVRVKVVSTGQVGWVFSGTDRTHYIIWKTKAAIAAEVAVEKIKQAAIKKAAADARAAKIAGEKAQAAAAEQAAKDEAIADISVALGNPDPADLLVFVNQGDMVPNLAKNLDGQLVSATGLLSVCHTEIMSPYLGARSERYGKLVADFLASALPSGAEPSSVDLEHCGSQTPADVVYFQTGQLEAAPLKFVKYLNENVNVSLVATGAFSLEDAEHAEASFVAAQQKALEDKAALKKATLENIRSGTEDGFGFVVVKGRDAPLCYFDGGEISAVMAGNTEQVLRQVFGDATLSEDVNKLNTSLKQLNSLDEIYISITRKPPICGWMFGDRTSLQKIAAAMDRDGINFDTLPYWTTAEEITPLIDAANIEQQANTEAKAAQDATAEQAAEKKTEEQRQEAEANAAETEATKQSQVVQPAQVENNSNDSPASTLQEKTDATTAANTSTNNSSQSGYRTIVPPPNSADFENLSPAEKFFITRDRKYVIQIDDEGGINAPFFGINIVGLEHSVEGNYFNIYTYDVPADFRRQIELVCGFSEDKWTIDRKNGNQYGKATGPICSPEYLPASDDINGKRWMIGVGFPNMQAMEFSAEPVAHQNSTTEDPSDPVHLKYFTYDIKNSQEICKKDWTERGVLNRNMFNVCVEHMRETYDKIVKSLADLEKLPRANEILQRLVKENTDRGNRQDVIIALDIDRQVDGWLNIEYERQQGTLQLQLLEKCNESYGENGRYGLDYAMVWSCYDR